MITGKDLIIFRSDEAEEWSALYVNGELEYVGDHYLVEERIQSLLGIETRTGDFLKGGNQRDDAARTISELEEYEQAKQNRVAEAAELERKAQELIEEAKRLRG